MESWPEGVVKAIKLKKGSFKAWWVQVILESADRYLEPRGASASVVADATTSVWEQFGDAMEKNFQLP